MARGLILGRERLGDSDLGDVLYLPAPQPKTTPRTL